MNSDNINKMNQSQNYLINLLIQRKSNLFQDLHLKFKVIQEMSSMQNNASNQLFPTELLGNQLTPRPRKKSFQMVREQSKNSPSFSSILLRNKQNSKQRLVAPQLETLIGKIQSFVEDIDNKVQNRVQLVKQVYVNEYKQQVVEMSTQLKNLREKLDNEVMKEKANEKMFYLEEERDFFRHQVTKLSEQMNRVSQENKKLKRQLEEEKRELVNYKQVVYNLEEKVLKLKNANMQRNKLFKTEANKTGYSNTQKEPSTIDTKQVSGSKTDRGFEKGLKNLETIQDEQEMSRSEYRLRGSQSMKAYPKYSTPQRQPMRSTVNYPRLTVQKLQKIEGYSQLLQRQQIIDECINELKRQIYYRSLSIGDRESKLHFNEASQVKFQTFTKTDKKELIVKLLSSEKVLGEFYQFLFNNNNVMRNSQTELMGATQLITNKLELNCSQGFNTKWSLHKLKFSDARANTHQLNNLKTEFSKKIFDIKHNR